MVNTEYKVLEHEPDTLTLAPKIRNPENISEITGRYLQRKKLYIFWQHHELMNNLALLERIQSMVDRSSQRMSSFDGPMWFQRQVAELYKLRQGLVAGFNIDSASKGGRLIREIAGCLDHAATQAIFGSELEHLADGQMTSDKRLKPLPDDKSLEHLADGLVKISKHVVCDKTIAQWADEFKQYRRERQEVKSAGDLTRDQIVDVLLPMLKELRDEMRDPLSHNFVEVIISELQRTGKFQLFDHADGVKHGLMKCKEMQSMKFTVLGMVIEGMLKKNAITEGSNKGLQTKEHIDYMTLSTIAMPQFSFQLAELIGVLRSQIESVKHMQNQVLAVSVTLLIAFLQALIRDKFPFFRKWTRK